MAQIEVITGVDRRRRWTLEEKERLLAEAFAPGVNVKAFCRRHDVASGSLYTWRKELARLVPPTTGSGFARVAVTEAASLSATTPANGVHPAPVLPVSALPPPGTAQTSLPSMLPVAVCDLPVIEIEVRGSKVRIPATMPAALASAVAPRLGAAMIIRFPSEIKIWLATGRTDMRKGMNSLALQVQESAWAQSACR